MLWAADCRQAFARSFRIAARLFALRLRALLKRALSPVLADIVIQD